MSDTEEEALRKLRERARHPTTAELLFPEHEVRLAIERAKAELRQEFVANIDRLALERAIKEAQDAQSHSESAVKRSQRRWITILVILFLLGATQVALITYAITNRTRIEFIERQYA